MNIFQYPDVLGEHQFCRNPGGLMSKPWCYVDDEMNEKALCDVIACGELSGCTVFFKAFWGTEMVPQNCPAVSQNLLLR